MPPRSTVVGVKDILFWSLILSCVGALQQPPYHQHNAYPSNGKHTRNDLSRDAAAAAHRWQSAAADSLHHTQLNSEHRKFRDTHPQQNPSNNNLRTRPSSNSNERALATLSPAENSDPAIRAPPAYKPTATGGIASRHQARSLQDWQVEDIILLATVDGKIHARDRRTGAPKWQLETDRAMVETIYHRNNRSTNEEEENLLEQKDHDPLWIVEPSQDGAIYVYAPGSGVGMQRLGYTVRELANMAPYASDGQPAVAYTAEKRNTLYTINAATGNIIKSFSSAGSIVNEDRSCRRVNPLESLDEDECEPIGTLTLGRTEYTIGIQDRNSGEPISTIRYFEWGPNNRDEDLFKNYRSTMDNKYVYTKHDGWVFGLEMDVGQDSYTPVPVNKPIYRHKFLSPVARVYDIVRPYDDMSSDAALVVLPQPVAPSPNEFVELEIDPYESIYVNCTKDGSWFAFSERNYPMVTEGATAAQFNAEDSYNFPVLSWPMSRRDREWFAGVHQLSPITAAPHDSHLIDAPELPPKIDPPEVVRGHSKNRSTAHSLKSYIPTLKSTLVTILLVLLACTVLYQNQLSPRKRLTPTQALDDFLQSKTRPVVQKETEEEQPKIREAEPAQETIFPHEEQGALEQIPSVPSVDEKEDKPEVEAAAEEENAKEGEEVKPKKKATRGKRGGRKQKEKEQQQADAQARRKLSQPPRPAEMITVAASESPQVSGPLQINSLVIHTDKVIGQGSCGTSVFEGSFEGRDVAVKRMLSQYYDLASQEVSFLQQSDDHPNVVRYFCQQKDDHFLYIAVELCQASLFEVWEGDQKARTEDRQLQLRTLKHSIQQDVPRALHQLAAGLYHLHNLRIIHRDIKPQNILVAFPKKNQNTGPRLVISDFGLGKNLPENVSTLVDPTGNAGTSGWKAPELISQPRDTESRHSQNNSHTGTSEGPNGTSSGGVKRAADIFSLGCLFFWVLTDGNHPYEDENGWQQLRELNIKRDNKKMGVLERWNDAYEPMQLITSMLEHLPEHRPTALQVLNHPFFWSAQKRLGFLCDVSDHFEREPRGLPDDDYAGDSLPLSILESRAEEVIGLSAHHNGLPDFLSKLDRHFVDTLGKQRKYSGNRLLDLLRALRNKKNHYEDMPEDVKRRVGSLPEGYLAYWGSRFPRLLMACYEVIHECGLEKGDRFKGYFREGSV